jgi:hypothetical protein
MTFASHSERCAFIQRLWDFYIKFHQIQPDGHGLAVNSAAWFDIARLLAIAAGTEGKGPYALSNQNKALQILRRHSPMLRQKVKTILGV